MQSDIPEITLKKVGKDREKKKGGAALFGGGRGAQGAFRGALGGSGSGFSAGSTFGLAGRLGGGLVSKIALSVIVTALFGGAWGVGMAMKPQSKKSARAFSDAGAMKARDSQKYDGDTSHLPGSGRGGPSGLALVSGSLGGKSAEELAAEKAAADKAAADAAAAEQSGTADPVAAAGAVAGPDPAALAAAQAEAEAAKAAAGKGGLGQRFGALSSSMGGGGGSKLSGGAGLSGGMSGKFDTTKLGAGVRGFGSNPVAARASGRAPTRSSVGARGIAGRQLNNAFRAGQASRTQNGTGASYTAGQPFDNGLNTSNMIADPAAAMGGPSSVRGTTNPNGSTGGAGGGSEQPNTVGNGSGESNPEDCTRILPETFGESVRGRAYENSPGSGCVLSGDGAKDASPWSALVKIATGLLKAAMILLTIATVLGLAAKASTFAAPFLLSMAMYASYAAAALAGMATLLGIAVMATGNKMGGGLIAAIGGIMTVAAYIAAQKASAAAEAAKEAKVAQAAADAANAINLGPMPPLSLTPSAPLPPPTFTLPPPVPIAPVPPAPPTWWPPFNV